MTAWERSLNRELGDLSQAHSMAMIDTPEYRRRRRALLNATLRQQVAASHTLRRPAGGAKVSSRPPMRVHTCPPQRAWPGLAWWLGASLLLASVLAWMLLH